jgi:hypothetical protein
MAFRASGFYFEEFKPGGLHEKYPEGDLII